MKFYWQIYVLILFYLFINSFNNTAYPAISNENLIIRHSARRSVEPGEFPLFVYVLTNTSLKTIFPEFQLETPGSWNIVTFITPDSIPPMSKQRVRVTLNVPKSIRADSLLKLSLVTQYDLFADTVVTDLTIKRKRNVKIGYYKDEISVFPLTTDSLSFMIKNDGNVTDTVDCHVVLPPHWDIQPTVDETFIVPAFSIKKIKLYFNVPGDVKFQNQYTIRIDAGTRWNNEKLINTIPVNILKMPQKKNKNMGLYLPLNMGFSLYRIQKGYYPDTEIYLETDTIKWNEYNFVVESTIRSDFVKTSHSPEFYMRRYKISLFNKYTSLRFGDSSLLFNPLLTNQSITKQNSLSEYRELSRGGFIKQQLNDFLITVFKGKKLFEDLEFFYSSIDYNVNKLNLSTVYFKADTAEFMTASAKLGDDTKYINIYTGISKADNVVTSGAAQVRAKTVHKKFYLSGALHWAGLSFQGKDRGTMGALFSSRYTPFPGFYVWSNVHRYKHDLNYIYPDSVENVTDVKLRSFVRIKRIVDASSSFNMRDISTSVDSYTALKSFDITMQRNMNMFIPFVGFRALRNRLYTDVFSETKRYSVGLNFFYNLSRFKLEYRMINQKHFGNADQVVLDLDTNINSFLLGFSLTVGDFWSQNEDHTFHKVPLTFGGIRTGFLFHPFNKNYNLRFELSNSISELDMLTREWRVSASMTSTVLPRFNLPVPFIKNKGSLRGEFFIDKNQNGIREPDEPGLSQILLHFNNETVITNSNGEFEFSPVVAGDYEFKIDGSTLPAYYKLEGQLDKLVSIQRGTGINLQIPLVSVCLIEGNIFLDNNGNNKLNSTDGPLPQVRVLLENKLGLYREVYTNSNGHYQFVDLAPGFYKVKIDEKWLPKRTILEDSEKEVVLTIEDTFKQIDFPVTRKKLEIRKTFTAP